MVTLLHRILRIPPTPEPEVIEAPPTPEKPPKGQSAAQVQP